MDSNGKVPATQLGQYVLGDTVIRNFGTTNSSDSSYVTKFVFYAPMGGRFRITGEIKTYSNTTAFVRVVDAWGRILASAFSTTSVTYVPFIFNMAYDVPRFTPIEIQMMKNGSFQTDAANVTVKGDIE